MNESGERKNGWYIDWSMTVGMNERVNEWFDQPINELRKKPMNQSNS